MNCLSTSPDLFPLAALALGLLGSLHCVGMCGPIALALPVNRARKGGLLAGALLYNTGRATTYAVLGMLSGLAGGAVQWAAGQQALSIVAGVIILLTLLAAALGDRLKFPKPVTQGMGALRRALGKLFKDHRPGSLYAIGLLNGLLPCGMVYAGLGGAAATGSMWEGALFMFIFGIGTVPALLALSLAGSKISSSFREKLRKAVPVFVAAMALLLVLRGLGLGIPYVSPSYSQEGKPACCHCHPH